MQQMIATQPQIEATSPDAVATPDAPATGSNRCMSTDRSNPALMLVTALAVSALAWALLVACVLALLAA